MKMTPRGIVVTDDLTSVHVGHQSPSSSMSVDVLVSQEHYALPPSEPKAVMSAVRVRSIDQFFYCGERIIVR